MHWLENSKDAENVDWVVILDADMIIRGPIIPWELGAEKGRPVAAYYGYLSSLSLSLSRVKVILCQNRVSSHGNFLNCQYFEGDYW